jgi:hypothetical protein
MECERSARRGRAYRVHDLPFVCPQGQYFRSALDVSLARSCSFASSLSALSVPTVDGERRAPDLLSINTKSRSVSMTRYTRFARYGGKCVGSRSRLGEAFAADDSSHLSYV